MINPGSDAENNKTVNWPDMSFLVRDGPDLLVLFPTFIISGY